VDEAREVDCAAVVTRGETTEVLEAIEAALDAVAVLVGAGVMRDGDLAVALGGITASAFMSAMRWRKSLLSEALSASTAQASWFSRRAGAAVMLLAWPGVIKSRKERPSVSQSMWILESIVSIRGRDVNLSFCPYGQA
jgi:hypothetical protein